jgi:hypothetical protein
MALFDLNRANDTPIATLQLASIAPINWHKFPPRVASMADSNQNEAKPRYDSMTDWAGGVKGDDTNTASAAVALARSDGGAAEPDYMPRTEADRATQLGTTLAVDISRRRGAIEPRQPYPVAGDPPVAAPVVTSIAPNTAPAGSVTPVVVMITGTGFTAWSLVQQGGNTTTPDPSMVYISPTQLQITIYPKIAVPGTASIAVRDHGVLSNVDKLFTFT